MFSLNDTNLPSDPLSCFENLIELTLIVIITFDERIREKKYNMILIKKLEKYLHYHKVKLMNMNTSKVKIYYLLIKAEYRSI